MFPAFFPTSVMKFKGIEDQKEVLRDHHDELLPSRRGTEASK